MQPDFPAPQGQTPPAAFRPLLESDLPALAALDSAAQQAADPGFDSLPAREQEGRLCTSLPAIKFYARSGHSFVAEKDGYSLGFILAQAIWRGDDAIVLVRSTVLDPAAPATLQAEIYSGLMRAVFKSAIDTATYQVHFCPLPGLELPSDLGQIRSLGSYDVRYLGSRDSTAP